MPYPLAKLPYGLRCRLHALGTPLERYQLQIAAGNASVCPPIQIVQETKDNIEFICWNADPILYTSHSGIRAYPMTFSDDSLICGIKFTFDKTRIEHLTSETLKHVLVRPKKLTFCQCALSRELLMTIKAFMASCKNILLYECTGVNFFDLLSAFPALEQLDLQHTRIPETWFTELSPFNGQLSYLRGPISKEYPTSISSDQIVAFLKAQRRDFTLQLNDSNDGERISELQPGLDAQLQSVKYDHFEGDKLPNVTLCKWYSRVACYCLP